MSKFSFKKTKILFFYLLLWSIPLLIFFHNVKATIYNCFNSNDLGIYSQALFEMAGNGKLNPFVSVRGIHTFNDHVDPILLLVAPLVRFFSFKIEGVLLIEMLFVWATMFLTCLVIKKNSSDDDGKNVVNIKMLYFLAVLLLCKGLLVSLAFPIHPSTWSILPCFLLVHSIYKQKLTWILACCFFLCLFREDYPFALLGLSFGFLCQREWKKSLTVLSISVPFILFDFIWRPLLLGPIYVYGNDMLRNFISSPVFSLWEGIKKIKWGTITMFYPFFIPLGYLIFKEVKNWRAFFKHPVFPILCFLAPLLVIRILAQAFHFHYTAPIVVTLFSILVHSSLPEEIIKRPKWATLVLLLFFLSSSSVYTKMVNFALLNKSAKCIVNEEKRKSTENILKLVKEIKEEETILSTGGIIPQILRPSIKLHHLGGLSYKLENYDYLLLELNQSGDTWPLTSLQVQNLRDKCRPYATQILHEDPFFLLIKGKLPGFCSII